MPENFSELVAVFIDLISLAIPLVFSLTLLVIIWKVVDAWVIHGGDTTRINEGKDTILIGVIALVVMSGIWGIVALLRYSIFGS